MRYFTLGLQYQMNELFSYCVLAVVGFLAWRLVRAYERRRSAPDSLQLLDARMALLEDAVHRVATGVEQTVDAQRFTTRVLLKRSEDRA